MDDKSLKILTLYIGSWGWNILAVIFFVEAIYIFAVGGLNLGSFIFGFGLVGLICESISLARRRELASVK